MGEKALQGVSAAPGITVGAAVVLDRPGAARVARGADPEAEAIRARDALHRVATDLEDIASALRREGRGEEADIIETGVLMAMDPQLIARVEMLVVDAGLGPAEALSEAAEETALEL